MQKNFLRVKSEKTNTQVKFSLGYIHKKLDIFNRFRKDSLSSKKLRIKRIGGRHEKNPKKSFYA